MRSRWRRLLYVSILVMVGAVALFFLHPPLGNRVAVPVFIVAALCYICARIAMFVGERRR